MSRVWIGIVALAMVGMAVPQAGAGTPQSVYKSTASSVVFIFAFEKAGASMGTGSIITRDGLVVTNAHVIYNKKTQKPYPRLMVHMHPGKISGDRSLDLKKRYAAEFVAWDVTLDLALMRIKNAPPNLPTLPLASPISVEIGQPVIAVGHPGGGGLWTLTSGTVGAIRANMHDVKGKHMYQTDAGLNPGNSGGPLIDMDGHMVGVNTSIYRRGANGIAITDINFALQSRVLHAWVQSTGNRLAYAASPKAPAKVPAEKPKVVVPAEKPKVVVPAEKPKVVVPAEKPKVVVPAEKPKVPAEKPKVVPAEKPKVPKTQPRPLAKRRPFKQLTPSRPFDKKALLEDLKRAMDRVENELGL